MYTLKITHAKKRSSLFSVSNHESWDRSLKITHAKKRTSLFSVSNHETIQIKSWDRSREYRSCKLRTSESRIKLRKHTDQLLQQSWKTRTSLLPLCSNVWDWKDTMAPRETKTFSNSYEWTMATWRDWTYHFDTTATVEPTIEGRSRQGYWKAPISVWNFCTLQLGVVSFWWVVACCGSLEWQKLEPWAQNQYLNLNI